MSEGDSERPPSAPGGVREVPGAPSLLDPADKLTEPPTMWLPNLCISADSRPAPIASWSGRLVAASGGPAQQDLEQGVDRRREISRAIRLGKAIENREQVPHAHAFGTCWEPAQ